MTIENAVTQNTTLGKPIQATSLEALNVVRTLQKMHHSRGVDRVDPIVGGVEDDWLE
jgi:hypothetical protein